MAATRAHAEVSSYNGRLGFDERFLDENGDMIPLDEMTLAQRYHLRLLANGIAPGAPADEFAYQVDLWVEHGEDKVDDQMGG
ncbi:MAG: hypothetical protein ACRD0U_13955 [Acidimicrobiales bacterium]